MSTEILCNFAQNYRINLALGQLEFDAPVLRAGLGRVRGINWLVFPEPVCRQPSRGHAQFLHHIFYNRKRATLAEFPVVGVFGSANQRRIVGVTVDADDPVDLGRDAAGHAAQDTCNLGHLVFPVE